MSTPRRLDPPNSFNRSPYPKIFLLTCSAIAVNGYHLGTDDAEIYLPAVKKFVDPALYPFGDQFFTTQGGLSLFPEVVGLTARLFHLPVSVAVLGWHFAGIFLLLLASWRLLGTCFDSERARWTGVSLLAAVLTVPVANTALTIMDPYLTARSISTPSTIFAISFFLTRNYKRASAWWLLTVLIHPLMSLYALAFVGVLSLTRLQAAREAASALVPEPELEAVAPAAIIMLPTVWPKAFNLQPAQGPYAEVLHMRSYFFLQNWAWYEWCGIILPLAILWRLSVSSLRGTLPVFRSICRALVIFATLSTAVALLVSIPARMQMFARLQPMRSLHLVYVIFFLFLGGLIGEYAFHKNARLRAALLFVPLACGMAFVGYSTYPASPHVEWPGLRWRNPYLSAFFWIHDNTPKDAVFALDPRYMSYPGVDEHGFRALAERSALADYYKDSGAVSLFPQLAGEWKREVTAQQNWPSFTAPSFEQLARQYPIDWIVVQGQGPPGYDCPYRDQGIAVCRLPQTAKLQAASGKAS